MAVGVTGSGFLIYFETYYVKHYKARLISLFWSVSIMTLGSRISQKNLCLLSFTQLFPLTQNALL